MGQYRFLRATVSGSLQNEADSTASLNFENRTKCIFTTRKAAFAPPPSSSGVWKSQSPNPLPTNYVRFPGILKLLPGRTSSSSLGISCIGNHAGRSNITHITWHTHTNFICPQTFFNTNFSSNIIVYSQLFLNRLCWFCYRGSTLGPP